MSRPSPLTYLPLWHRALEQEIGIRFEISGVDRQYFLATLYDCRKKAADPTIADLIVFKPAAPFDNELWICKSAVEVDS